MTGYVRVVNLRPDMGSETAPEPHEVCVRIDRQNPVLGNPYVLKNKLDAREREKVISAYRDDLLADMTQKGPMFDEVNAIADRVENGESICLQCWCKPLPCHGDVVAQAVEDVLAARKLFELWEERAAIHEFEAGLTRKEAEKMALQGLVESHGKPAARQMFEWHIAPRERKKSRPLCAA